MVDDSSAPIVLLDFDGVLNAFPDAIGVRYEDVGVAPVVECRGRMTDDFGPERAFRLDGVETVRLGRRGGTWHLHWSRELAANLYGLAESGVIDLRWLSTWQPYVHILDGLLGWDPDVVHNTHWYDPLTGRGRMGGKLHAVVDAYGLSFSDKRLHALRDAVGASLVEAGAAVPCQAGLLGRQSGYCPTPEAVRSVVEQMRAELLEAGPVCDDTAVLVVLLERAKCLKQYFSDYERKAIREKIERIVDSPEGKLVKDMMDYLELFLYVIAARGAASAGGAG